MFILNDDMSIYITRGDTAVISVDATDQNGNAYVFQPGDVVRFKVVEKKNYDNVVLQRDLAVEAVTTRVSVLLEERDTRIGDVISKPVDYWYEVELNPFTNPQTIIGYDDYGAKIFKLLPEGKDIEVEITEEDVPVVDAELSLTSERPIQNQAVARAMMNLSETVEKTETRVLSAVETVEAFDEEIAEIKAGIEEANGKLLTTSDLKKVNSNLDTPLNEMLSDGTYGLSAIRAAIEAADWYAIPGTDVTLLEYSTPITPTYNSSNAYKWAGATAIASVKVPNNGVYRVDVDYTGGVNNNNGMKLYLGVESPGESGAGVKYVGRDIPAEGAVGAKVSGTYNCESLYLLKGQVLMIRGMGLSTGSLTVNRLTVKYDKASVNQNSEG